MIGMKTNKGFSQVIECSTEEQEREGIIKFFNMENQTTDYGQQNFTLPHDVVPLPSGGVFYKNKKKSIKVGYLTASDENILMAGGLDITTNLLRNKIYESDLRIEDMIEGDVESILVFLRNTAFGPEMDLNLIDPVTKKPFKTTVALDELNVIKGQSPNEDGAFTTISGSFKPFISGFIIS